MQARLRTCQDRPPRRGVRAPLLIAFLLSLLFAGAARACPSCNQALSQQDAAAGKLTRAYANSISLLMWTPYLLFGGVTFAIVRSARRPKKA